MEHDADLINLCNTAEALLSNQTPTPIQRSAVVAALKEIASTRAKSLAGIKAKAALLHRLDDNHPALTSSLVADLRAA